jgi:predicted outer membrane repeat protein
MSTLVRVLITCSGLAAVVALSGCAGQATPREGQFDCLSESDCPAGWVCSRTDMIGPGKCYSDASLVDSDSHSDSASSEETASGTPSDTAVEDSGSESALETGDTGWVTDTGSNDVDPSDTVITDTSVTDTHATDTGVTDTGTADTVATDSGTADTVATDDTGECTADAAFHCYLGDVWSYDSCGVRDHVQTKCPDHADCVSGSATTASCVCRNNWIGLSCEVCPENWDPAADCAVCTGNWAETDECLACLPGWAEGDCNTCVRYVDAALSATGTHDGLDWATAFTAVQPSIDAALAAVNAGTGISRCEVWVANGTFFVRSTGANDTIQLVAKVDVYGGFAGNSVGGFETSKSQRDIALNETILDGRNSSSGMVQKVYHVVTGANDTRLDGFTIRNGSATVGDGSSGVGGGVYINNTAPMISHCRITSNTANLGGGMYIDNPNPGVSIAAVVFSQNSAGDQGGAVFLEGQSQSEIANSIFLGNTAVNNGGAIMVGPAALSTVTNCTFNANTVTAGSGGAIANAMGWPTLINSIVWGDTAAGAVTSEIAELGDLQASVIYSDVKGGHVGSGNLSEDPLFVVSGSDLRLRSTSPCIDKASDAFAPVVDLLGQTRIDIEGRGNVGVVADMGAYEYHP